MSKPKHLDLKGQERPQKNYANYGYRDGQKVSLDAKFVFGVVAPFLNKVIQESKKEMYGLGEDGKPNPQVYFTANGIEAITLLEDIKAMHIELVERGIAVSFAELQKELNNKKQDLASNIQDNTSDNVVTDKE